ncbi:hypothetical protein U1Q18_004383 [Sarracenia purpurea var. burkii]
MVATPNGLIWSINGSAVGHFLCLGVFYMIGWAVCYFGWALRFLIFFLCSEPAVWAFDPFGAADALGDAGLPLADLPLRAMR